jgi:hypothetical protein
MSFRLDDLPAVDSAGSVGRSADPALSDAYHDSSTPSLLTQVAALGAVLGMDAVRVLQERFMPGTRELAAMHLGAASPSYSIWPDCTIYPDTDGCDAPCWGFPRDQMSTWYCATCDEQAADPTHNPAWNWHYSGMRGSLEYMDREPDVCNGRDAWKWKIDSACRGCNENITFRCHDGWKRYEPGGPLTPTICEGIIACDGELTVCP